MNKVILMGRPTKQPELKRAGETSICSFTLAVNRRFTPKGQEKQADFPQIVSFGKTAEFCANYFEKGSQIAIVGRIQTRNWEDDSGTKHYATEVVADEAYFADSKKDGKDSSGGGFNPTDDDEMLF